MVETTYSFKAIWDALYDKMLEIATWNTARIWAVYNHDIKIEDWINLPAIIITPDDGNIRYLDSCSYQTELNFKIRLIDRIQKNISEVEDNMRVVADMVMQKLKEIETIVWSNDSIGDLQIHKSRLECLKSIVHSQQLQNNLYHYLQ